MYEDLQNVLESILEDENEVNKFLEMETMDELYEYFKNKIPNLSVEEFDSFIFDLLEEYAKSAQAVQNLDSSALSKVAGGAGAKSKIAAITMSLLSLFPMAPVGSAHVDTESNIGSAQNIKTDKQGYFDKVKAILLSKFNSAKQTVSNKYKDAKEFVADKYAKTKKWVVDNPKLSAGIAFSAVVLLAAATYGIHRCRHSGQQTPPGQPQPQPQLQPQPQPQPQPLPQPQPQPVRAVIEDAPEPSARRATVEQGPVADEVQIQAPPAASSGSQTVRSNVPLPTGEEETVMDRLARDARAAQRQREQRAVQAAYDASPRGRYDQLKHQPLQLKYTDEWHQQSQQTEQGDVPATNNTRTNVRPQITKEEVEGPVSSLNNRPMGSPTAGSPLLRPADTSPVPIPKTPSVPHSMPTLGGSAREERRVPQTPVQQTPVQQTPVQSAQAQLDSAQPTTPARPSPARAAYVSQYTTTQDVQPKIAKAIRRLEKDRRKREAQHATQEHSTTPQPQGTPTYRHPVHDNLKKRAQVLNNTLLGQNSPATPQRGGAMPVAPLVAAANVRTQTPVPPAQTPATSTNLGVEPAAPMSSITRRPKPTFTRRPPTARHASAPTTPDADAAVDPQTPVAPRVATPQADSSKPTSPAAAVTPAPSSPAKNPVVSSESPQNKGKNKQR